ncbi:MAG TPA: aminotransferase class I/II-fold pyridoxal phosphate-dependent enzyme [Candidatus Brocadiia bacterium]|nr:aminotransferase class I/II-fold pyridoxal phosphate-dependent enzyme [Candidatus Brocadiales bacterium]
MLDFTSVLYLGMRHGSRSLRPWNQLTTGVPAALALPPGMDNVAQRLASLQGCERATLGTSTLHLFWDLFGILADPPEAEVTIYMDAGAYPIVRWGVERAEALGIAVRKFPQHNVSALQRLIRQDALCGVRPLVVSDGFCTICGKPAPVAQYLECVRPFDGLLILDDTQALGILGHSPEPDVSYGWGGGGSLRWSGVDGPDVLMVSSLAKGFGVPIAVLSGNKAIIRRFEMESETRVHCSPPSLAVIHAAEHALNTNREHGDALRLRLAQLVSRFRNRLKKAGLSATGGLFPVQTLAPIPEIDARTLHQRLLQLGIQTVLRHGANKNSPCISFLITTRHTPRDIDRAVDALTYVVVKNYSTYIGGEK